jgi:hypothetical protein
VFVVQITTPLRAAACSLPTAAFCLLLFIFTQPLSAQVSPGSWPSTSTHPWVAVLTTSGVPVTDAAEGSISPEIDMLSTTADPSSAYIAYDGTNVFFRFQLEGDPRNTSGFWISPRFWKVEFSNANNTLLTKVELIVNNSYVFLVVDGRITVNFFLASITGTSDVRVVQGSSSYFLDFQVPHSTLTTAEPSLTAAAPFKVFYSTGTYGRPSTTLDYMQGSSVSFSSVETALGLASIKNGVFPVELTSFTAHRKEDAVALRWNTATEIDNYGFAVERAAEDDAWTEIAFIPGAGSSSTPRSYAYRDTDYPRHAARISYRLRQVDRDGSIEYSPVVIMYAAAASLSGITDAYPNPFNPSTTVSFTVAQDGPVRLELMDVTGCSVLTVIDGENLSAGAHARTIDAARLPSGQYFLRLTGAGGMSIHPVMLVK